MVVVYDLDDTLYDEVDFVKSGFLEISEYLKQKSTYEFMYELFLKEGSGKIFNKLIEEYSLKTPLKRLIEIYRFHKPRISLDSTTLELLEFTKKFPTALISDGDYIMQKNKFEVLGLHRFIEYEIFTEFYHTKKPEKRAFLMVMDRFKSDRYIYISDNPKKDFLAPKSLGWTTIRYKNPRGIYRDIENSADFEFEDKESILNKLKDIDG